MFCDSINASGINKQAGFTINIISPTATSIENQEGLIADLRAYPNPVKDILTLEFNLMEQSQIEVTIIDLFGKNIATIGKENLQKGENKLEWNTLEVPNGVYLLNINSNKFRKIKKIVLSK